MELVLNLAWLLLAAPAYWAWRRSGDARARHDCRALQALLALGCVLVLLFPVISATDDLCAMRAEIEESPSNRRSIRQASNDKGACNIRLHAPAAVVAPVLPLAP